MHLTTQEHGAYLLILLSYYANASPPMVDDLPAIARLSPRDWVAIRPRIAKFFEEKDGKWYQKKADEILAESDSTHVARSQAGKKGNAIRWQSPSDRPAIPERSPTLSPSDRIPQPQPQLRERESPLRPPTESEISTECEMQGYPQEEGQAFFRHYEGKNLWLNQHGRLINWQVCLRDWVIRSRGRKPKNGKLPKADEETMKVICGCQIEFEKSQGFKMEVASGDLLSVGTILQNQNFSGEEFVRLFGEALTRPDDRQKYWHCNTTKQGLHSFCQHFTACLQELQACGKFYPGQDLAQSVKAVESNPKRSPMLQAALEKALAEEDALRKQNENAPN